MIDKKNENEDENEDYNEDYNEDEDENIEAILKRNYEIQLHDEEQYERRHEEQPIFCWRYF